jgi:hypothetical protein
VDRFQPAPAVRPLEGLVERAQVEQPQPLGLLERLLEPPLRHDLGEVEQSPRHRRHPNPLALGHVARIEAPNAVDVEPGVRAPAPRRHRHVHASARDAQQRPQTRGAAVAQHGFLPAREHRRHRPRPRGQRGVPDRVDAAVERVEAAVAHPHVDRALPEPELQQLRAGDHSVLARRQLGQTWVDSMITMVAKSTHVP